MDLNAYRIASKWIPGDSPERLRVLARDIVDVAVEEQFETDAQGMNDAARILLARVGGLRNVPSYVDCLVAGERRKV